jgi:hypothetical protein
MRSSKSLANKSLASADFGGILQSLQRLERFFSAQRICENGGFAGIMAQTPQAY